MRGSASALLRYEAHNAEASACHLKYENQHYDAIFFIAIQLKINTLNKTNEWLDCIAAHNSW